MRDLPLLDILDTIACIGGLAYVVVRLAATVIPLQIREARVVNGLANLRRQLLINGMANLLAALIAAIILALSLLGVRSRLIFEFLIGGFVIDLIVNAETKHRIYHQQYTDEHKKLSERIAAEERMKRQADRQP